jgi:hypothetical protein
MDTNEKKQDWFPNGLNDGLAYVLEARDFVNFQDMVDKALVLENRDWFPNGLNDGLAYALEAREFINFQDMVDKALVLENRRGIIEQKRKMQRTGSQGSNTRFRVGSSS